MRCCVPLLLTAIATQAGQQPTFKVHTELVRLDVLVERNGRPVGGLTAADFIVEDNGVPQRVSLLAATDVVNVSMVLDVSGSMTSEMLRNAGAGVRAVMAAMHERDRHALYAVAGDVRRISLSGNPHSLSSESIARVLRETTGVHTSLFDALFAAIIQSDADNGPKLLTLLTDGRSNTSWLSARAAIDAAVRHETVLYPVAVGRDRSRYPVDVPPVAGDDGLRLLQILAERTGGRVIHADWSTDLAPVLDSIIREYRQRYILSFVPEGVGRGDGWHRLEVRLRNRSGNVHARSRYLSR